MWVPAWILQLWIFLPRIILAAEVWVKHCIVQDLWSIVGRLANFGEVSFLFFPMLLLSCWIPHSGVSGHSSRDSSHVGTFTLKCPGKSVKFMLLNLSVISPSSWLMLSGLSSLHQTIFLGILRVFIIDSISSPYIWKVTLPFFIILLLDSWCLNFILDQLTVSSKASSTQSAWMCVVVVMLKPSTQSAVVLLQLMSFDPVFLALRWRDSSPSQIR